MTVQIRHYAAAFALHAAIFLLLFVGVSCAPKVQPPPVIEAVLITGQNKIAKQTEVEQRHIQEEKRPDAKPVPEPPAPAPTPPAPPKPPKPETEDQKKQRLEEQQKKAAAQEEQKKREEQKKKENEEKKKQDDLRKAIEQAKKKEVDDLKKKEVAEIARKKAEIEEARKKEQAEIARKKAEEDAEKKRTAEEQRKAQEEERKRIDAEQKRLKAEEEARKAAREAEEKRKADDERQRKEDEARRLADEKRRKDAEAAAAKDALARALKAEENAQAQAAYISTVQISWAQELSAAIAENWVRPEGLANNLSCQVQITLKPNGEVTSVRIVTSSGVPAFDNSVVAAVYKTSPVPLPKDPKAFDPDLKPRFSPALLEQLSR